ncbi:hypothetical protein MBM_04255 [Drepanopeziza brunnea f. sp. 'multigermtubi' MB_m1]|uniref:Uncharacterized protein n=1 Tax=Marssonina brunnea f. sp. multigermtubi (strain MB_m1) TaxID=1072389 RepID=K1XX80_MARBU|nr:uncharacterized protein MBM_04255 [Drepanopeziza brunnea f. sp. 'multigermtubi' MB_m1]EKD17394.1 hypothetical protein MBM_04255 [Drepanopeziza brunnea f. sp. 'multigermtubi' MB_m1]
METKISKQLRLPFHEDHPANCYLPPGISTTGSAIREEKDTRPNSSRHRYSTLQGQCRHGLLWPKTCLSLKGPAELQQATWIATLLALRSLCVRMSMMRIFIDSVTLTNMIDGILTHKSRVNPFEAPFCRRPGNSLLQGRAQSVRPTVHYRSTNRDFFGAWDFSIQLIRRHIALDTYMLVVFASESKFSFIRALAELEDGAQRHQVAFTPSAPCPLSDGQLTGFIRRFPRAKWS